MKLVLFLVLGFSVPFFAFSQRQSGPPPLPPRTDDPHPSSSPSRDPASPTPAPAASLVEYPIASSNQYYFLRSAAVEREGIKGNCIGISTNEFQGRPVLETCEHGKDHIKIHWKGAGKGPDYGYIQFLHQRPESNLCLRIIPGTEKQDGEPIEQYPCENKPGQHWTLEENNGYFAIINDENGMCIAVDPKGPIGGKVYQTPCKHDIRMWWFFENTSPINAPEPKPPNKGGGGKGGNNGGGGLPFKIVCKGNTIPDGWVIVTIYYVSDCGEPNSSYQIHDVRKLPSGSWKNVCGNSPVPSGWQVNSKYPISVGCANEGGMQIQKN